LITKIGKIVEYDVNGELKEYVKGLIPILEQFVETFKGHPDLLFWNSILEDRLSN